MDLLPTRSHQASNFLESRNVIWHCMASKQIIWIRYDQVILDVNEYLYTLQLFDCVLIVAWLHCMGVYSSVYHGWQFDPLPSRFCIQQKRAVTFINYHLIIIDQQWMVISYIICQAVKFHFSAWTPSKLAIKQTKFQIGPTTYWSRSREWVHEMCRINSSLRLQNINSGSWALHTVSF